jgi:hypothetical protein
VARRKKNAGKGFGMMFHGAFGSKKEAVKKERQVHGFIQPRTIKGKKRFIVMSERKNPMRRRSNARMEVEHYADGDRFRASMFMKHMGLLQGDWATSRAAAKSSLQRQIAAAKHSRSTRSTIRHIEKMARRPRNPSELLVMGANPGAWGAGHEMMHNPSALENQVLTLWNAGYSDAKIADELNISIRDVRRIKRLFEHGVRSGPNPSSAWGYGHEMAHNKEIVLTPGQTYTIRTNPSAEAIRESFTGMPSDGYETYNVEGIPKGDYAQLGVLLALYVKPLVGGQVREIRFNATERPLLLSDQSGRQLYFLEGNQDISASLNLFNDAPQPGMIELGECRRIDYKQRKEHVPDPDVDEWKHEFGEENGDKPTLFFNERTKQLVLKGGDYTVRSEGITN